VLRELMDTFERPMLWRATFQTAFDGDGPYCATCGPGSKHLYRGYIGDGDALDMEVHRFRMSAVT
jgi:hypothetical protein